MAAHLYYSKMARLTTMMVNYSDSQTALPEAPGLDVMKGTLEGESLTVTDGEVDGPTLSLGCSLGYAETLGLGVGKLDG
jgi:hypothetical protein